MIDLCATEISPEERRWLLHPLVGGVILFTRNYSDRQQLTALVDTLHGLREPRLLVAVDHEGGRVQRFRDGFTRLPAAGEIGQQYNSDTAKARTLAETCGWLMAAELRAAGVDFSFAPVLDLDHGLCSVIGDRAFHSAPAIVADLASAYMNGMHQAGMPATGKHFPGHGAVAADSHHTLPVDERDFATLWQNDLVPFKRLIRRKLAAIMPAHVIYPNITSQPAGYSDFWIQRVLRRRLKFDGVVFSDDLSMGGAAGAGDYIQRAEAALAAGCDIALVCNAPAAVEQLLTSLRPALNPVAQLRRAIMHGRPAADFITLTHTARWRQAVLRLQNATATVA